MRTYEDFEKAYRDAEFTCHMNPNKKVWIVPTEDSYVVSVIKPRPDELPVGTSSVSYEVVDGEFIYAKDDVRATY